MLLDLEEKTRVLVEDIVERSAIGRGAIFVLGLSSSEVAGGTIGKASSREIWSTNCENLFLRFWNLKGFTWLFRAVNI